MQRFKELFERLNNIDIQELKEKCEYCQLTEVYEDIERMYEYYTELENEPGFIYPLPEHNKQRVFEHLSKFVNLGESIKKLDPNSSDIEKEKISHIQFAKEIYEYSYNFRRDFDGYISKKLSKEAKEVLESVKEVSVETGIGKFAGFFRETPEKGVFGHQASINCKFAFIFLVFGILIAYFIYDDLQSLLDKLFQVKISLEAVLIRIVVISFLSFIFYQVVRIFNVNMHLYTMNKHRQNILRTYLDFLRSVENNKLKDEIIMQAAKTIFEPGDTGYLSKKDSQIPIVEILKMIQKADKT